MQNWTEEHGTDEHWPDKDSTNESWTKVVGLTMNQGILRLIFRWIHIVFSLPILGYIYSPFEEIPKYAPAVRQVFVPIIVVSGLWMWKGHLLRRLVPKRSVRQSAAS